MRWKLLALTKLVLKTFPSYSIPKHSLSKSLSNCEILSFLRYLRSVLETMEKFKYNLFQIIRLKNGIFPEPSGCCWIHEFYFCWVDRCPHCPWTRNGVARHWRLEYFSESLRAESHSGFCCSLEEQGKVRFFSINLI